MRVGSESMNLEEAESFLNALPRFTDGVGMAYQPGLERITRLLDGMDRPQDAFEVIHIAGTNGKGSTASMVAAIGTAAGKSVGLHTSPHLFHVTERMRVNGRPATTSWLFGAVGRYRTLADEVRPSFFEFTVALSMLYFMERAVDVAVVEVGMGGRLDATNVLRPSLSIITNIGFDHTEFLGTSIGAIAFEKAGIIKEHVPIVTSADNEAARIIEEIAAERAAPIHHVVAEVDVVDKVFGLRGCSLTARTPLRFYENLFVGLAGRHQILNATTALRASELVYDELQSNEGPVYDGMRNVRELSGLRGRLEILHEKPLVIADVAHNADGLAAAIDHLDAVRAVDGRLHVLLGVMRDKDVNDMARRLAAAHALVRPAGISSSRALPPAELASQLRGWDVETLQECSVESGVREFLATAGPSDALLVTGSHLVIAQLESWFASIPPTAPPR